MKMETLYPFHPEIVHFCEHLSDRLFQCEKYPDFIALAFWLRKSHLLKLHEQFKKMELDHTHREPLGQVFHIPPTSIDVMWVYSWISALLGGNANIIRIPKNHSPHFQELLEIVNEALTHHTKVSHMTQFITYGHEEEITRDISSKVDARIIWGGDETIAKIRQIPLQPEAKEIVFPDRFSYTVIQSDIYLQNSPEEKEKLATLFFNDVYWFDQSACSSPRLILWLGNKSEQASQIFYQELQKIIQSKQFEISLGGYLLKQTYMYNQAISLPVEEVAQISNELSILKLSRLDPRIRIHPGQGLLYHVDIKGLEEIVSFATPHDQTLTYFGLNEEDLEKLIRKLHGKGLNRFVPIGQALNFDTHWDGHDLLQELTQEVREEMR